MGELSQFADNMIVHKKTNLKTIRKFSNRRLQNNESTAFIFKNNHQFKYVKYE